MNNDKEREEFNYKCAIGAGARVIAFDLDPSKRVERMMLYACITALGIAWMWS